MPKLFIATLLMFFAVNAFAQSKPSNEIVAEGGAKLELDPIWPPLP